MKVLMVKSIPLSEDTQAAWKASEDHEVKFLGRNRDVVEARDIAERYNYDLVVNLGNSSLKLGDGRDAGVPLVNSGEVVELLKDSAKVRAGLLGQHLPPRPQRGEAFWIKGGGFGGRNKQHMPMFDPEADYGFPDADLQRHVVGKEYRVITVGSKIVQVQRRIDDHPLNPEIREYEWVGLRGTPKAVKAFVKHLLISMPSYSLIGWDIIATDQAIYLLEGNTCPGVNEATAERILKQLNEDFFEEEEDVPGNMVDEFDEQHNPWDEHVRWNGVRGHPVVEVEIDEVDEIAADFEGAFDDFRLANEEVEVEDLGIDLQRIREKLEEKIVDQLYRDLIGDIEVAIKK